VTAQRSPETRHIWITGAGTGIGQELARQLAAAGNRVTVSGRRAEALAATSGGSANIAIAPLDVTDSKAVDAAVDEIERINGPIDIAVLNAALYQPMDAPDFDRDTVQRLFETNYMGVVNCLQPLLARMARRGGGRILLVASVAGYRGLPKAAAYGPTKAALINLAESLRPSAAAAGIVLQVVNPGFVATPMTAENRFPMPFLVTPERAASHIIKGLRGNSFEIAFPWIFVMLMKLARVLPDRLYFALTKRML
jgi:NAD(P)-dependent dehydrogenase (short-subunit alcohol dehydrogenase family)